VEYRTLGRTGIRIAPLCLGSDNFGDATPPEEAVKIINRALDVGINLIDTGDVYAEGESERIIGETIKNRKCRHQVLIATKVDHGRRKRGVSLDEFTPTYGTNDHGASRLNIIKSCEISLKRLQTDYLDLYQIHRQSPEIAIEETLGALSDLVRQGKVRYIGCTTHPSWAVMEAILVSELKGYVRYATEQPPYNLLDRRIENELLPMAEKYGLGIITWGAMAMGVLAGKYKDARNFPKDSRAAKRGSFYARRVTERGIAVGKEFIKIAEKAGIPPAQLAVLWCKDQPGVTAPLLGTRTLEQLEHVLPVLEMSLSDEVREACDQLVPPGSVVANFHNTAYWMKMQV